MRHFVLRCAGNFLVEPFLSAGVGYAFLMTSGSDSGGGGDLLVPLAAGISVLYDRLLLGLRVTYRHAFDGDLVTKADGTRAGLTSWATTVALGYEF